MNRRERRTAEIKLVRGARALGASSGEEAARLLIHAARLAIRDGLSEGDAAAKRRKAKRRETEVDPKPPVKPVRVAEPSKPRKPKYSGL